MSVEAKISTCRDKEGCWPVFSRDEIGVQTNGSRSSRDPPSFTSDNRGLNQHPHQPEMAEPTLQKEKHVRYWQRCLTSLLPTQYTSTDSSRMTLGCFILSALDLLGAGADTFPEKQRAEIKDWILKCQHPNGGFCGSPNHRFPNEYYVDVGQGKRVMDPANLPATFFALISLSYVGGFDEVRRGDALRWLKRLQRADGSFGELVTQEGVVEGGRDMRYCQTAMAVRWILRGDEKVPEGEDIDVESLVDHIRAGQVH